MIVVFNLVIAFISPTISLGTQIHQCSRLAFAAIQLCHKSFGELNGLFCLMSFTAEFGLECLASWKEDSDTYFYGRLPGIGDEEYRCFVSAQSNHSGPVFPQQINLPLI